MHLLVLVDGLATNHEKFKQWLTKRNIETGRGDKTGVKGNWDLQVREMRLYDIVVPEQVAEEWVADIKATSGYGGSSPDRMTKMKTATKWLSKMIGLKSMDHVEPTKERINENIVKGWWMHAFVIGALEDNHYDTEKWPEYRKQLKSGQEML